MLVKERKTCNVSLTLRGRPPLSPRSFELRNGFEAPPFFSFFFFFLRPTSKTNLKNGFGIFLTRESEQRVALLVTNSTSVLYEISRSLGDLSRDSYNFLKLSKRRDATSGKREGGIRVALVGEKERKEEAGGSNCANLLR